jgi:ElaB/YqjD/DUF883 family membrane-anchored ribosome-binding protein
MKIEPAKERLASGLESVVRDASELLRETTGQSSEKDVKSRDRLAATMEGATATFHRLEEQTLAAEATKNYLRQHPYGLMSFALGVGLLVGMLAGRK